MMPLFEFYKDFTSGQFAGDEYFRQSVLRPDETLESFWADYLEAYPEKAETLARARQLVEAKAYHKYGIRPLGVEEKASLKGDIFDRLGLKEEESGMEFSKRRFPVRPVAMRWMAAAILIVLVAAVWLLKGTSVVRGDKTALLTERTGANEMKTILLPDSSVVVLNANSLLEYSADLMVAGNREVRLEGNAFFSVKKDVRLRKFVVHARTLSVTVLGTELNVDARSKAAEVTLVSGRVKVSVDGNESTPMYLLPGNKVTLDTLQKTLIPSAVNTLLYSAWTDGKWNFRHTSLEEIGDLIGEYYGIAVTFKNKKNKRLCINAVIAVGSLQKLIPVLEQTLHIQMTLLENRLIIE